MRIAFAADFHSEHGVFDIYAVSADGTGLVRLTSDRANEDQPSWSPNGDRLAFAVGDRFDRLIYLMNSDGTGRRRLTTGGQEEHFPTWSPLGSSIAYLCGTSPYGICLFDVQRNGLPQIFPVEADFGPISWSPDGHQIVYTNYLHCTLSRLDIETHETTEITTGTGCDRSPSWSSDGRYIAFESTRRGEAFGDIYIIDVEVGLTWRVTEGAGEESDPDWGRSAQ